ncbi:MAG: hypothetical protein KC620_07135 [Myxococcales bacterium]|nr:hypothetical protein [Myxococcales bacterium]
MRRLLVLISLLAGCGEAPRAGALGETCGRTADCADPLRCVFSQCVTPERAKTMLAEGAGGTLPAAPAPAVLPSTPGGVPPAAMPVEPAAGTPSGGPPPAAPEGVPAAGPGGVPPP